MSFDRKAVRILSSAGLEPITRPRSLRGRCRRGPVPMAKTSPTDDASLGRQGEQRRRNLPVHVGTARMAAPSHDPPRAPNRDACGFVRGKKTPGSIRTSISVRSRPPASDRPRWLQARSGCSAAQSAHGREEGLRFSLFDAASWVVGPAKAAHWRTMSMHAPLMHSRGAQHWPLLVHAPHVPPTHAWLPQSRHDPHGGLPPGAPFASEPFPPPLLLEEPPLPPPP